jgi:malate dehydrogenase (oxaloacetate-decarboxylating)(NADP+)
MPLYLGYPHRRLEGEDYFTLVEEFVMAVQQRFPNALIQFEDFLTPNAYALLNTYRDKVPCFNDDIQGTAAVAVAGILAGVRATESSLAEQRVVMLGAGSATPPASPISWWSRSWTKGSAVTMPASGSGSWT